MIIDGGGDMQRSGLHRAKMLILLISVFFTPRGEAAFGRMWRAFSASCARYRMPRVVFGAACVATQIDDQQKVPLVKSENCPELKRLTTPGVGQAAIEYVRDGSPEKCLRIPLVGCSTWLYKSLIYNMAGWGFVKAAITDSQEYNDAQHRSKLVSKVPMESVLYDIMQESHKVNSESYLFWSSVYKAASSYSYKLPLLFGSVLDLPNGIDRVSYFKKSFEPPIT